MTNHHQPQAISEVGTQTAYRVSGLFIKGPLCVRWFELAGQTRSKSAVIVGLVIHFVSRLKRQREGLTVCPKRAENFGVKRKAFAKGSTT